MAKRALKRRTFIREWRKHRGVTLEQLAAKIDMSPGGLSMLERGERGYTQDTLEAIALHLHTDPAALLTLNPGNPEAIWSWLGKFGALTPQTRR